MAQAIEVLPAQRWAGFGLLITPAIDRRRAVLHVAGELDLASAPTLNAALEHHLHLGCRYIRLYLSATTFIDAAGIGALVNAHFKCLAAGGHCILLGVNARKRRLLRIVGLDDVLVFSE